MQSTTSEPSASGAAPQQTATNLRNSCEACAQSKVKCSAGKPSCSRCEKRGIRCEYLAAKRAGRKPAGATHGASSSSSQTIQLPSNTQLATDQLMPAPSSPSELSDILGGSDQFAFPDLSDVHPTGLTPPFPIDFSAFEPAGSVDDLFDTAGQVGNVNDGALVTLASGLADNDIFQFPLPTPRATASTSPAREDARINCREQDHLPCSCFFQALALLKSHSELFAMTEESRRDEAGAIQTAQEVLRQNKAAIEHVDAIFRCSGGHDGYLLMLVSLVISKVLELFAVVALDSPGRYGSQARRVSHVSSSGQAAGSLSETGSYSIDGRDWPRQSAQAVLSELVTVRRLAQTLSSKLRTHADLSNSSSAEQKRPKNESEALFETEPRPPIAGEVYRQMDLGLTSRVRTLSQQILERLREF